MWVSLSSIRSLPCCDQAVNQVHFVGPLAHRSPFVLPSFTEYDLHIPNVFFSRA
jgi:hypothetical protein